MKESTYWVIGSFVLLIVSVFISTFFCARQARRKFMLGKTEISDAEFLKSLGLEGVAADLALALRGRLASMISVPREMLHPGESMRQIKSCWFGDWDPAFIFMDIEDFWEERGLEFHLDPDFLKMLYKEERDTLGEYLRMAVSNYVNYLPRDIVLPTDSGNELTL